MMRNYSSKASVMSNCSGWSHSLSRECSPSDVTFRMSWNSRTCEKPTSSKYNKLPLKHISRIFEDLFMLSLFSTFNDISILCTWQPKVESPKYSTGICYPHRSAGRRAVALHFTLQISCHRFQQCVCAGVGGVL